MYVEFARRAGVARAREMGAARRASLEVEQARVHAACGRSIEEVRGGDKGGKSPMRCCSDDLGRGVLEGGLAGANHMRR